MEDIGSIVLATGALGTAAFGIVEALKWTELGLAGYRSIKGLLGPVLKAYEVAYGPDWERLLRAQYRGDQAELARWLRQGTRIGLTPATAPAMANFVRTVKPEDLAKVAGELNKGEDLDPDLRNILGRFELAVDARIQAALALAQERYAGTARVAATVVALGIAVVVGVMLDRLFQAVLVGIAAVPLAPIAKDLVSALQSASVALRGK
jgi:hypothetical protein